LAKRKVCIWFNEKEFEELKREAERSDSSVYSYVKAIILRRKLTFRFMIWQLITQWGTVTFLILLVRMFASILSLI